MKTYAYDIECFKNLFTATFHNVEGGEEAYVFYVGLDKTDYSDLKEFLNQEMVLVGFNNHSYDDPMLRFIMDYNGDKVTSEAYNLSVKLLDDNYRQDRALIDLRYPKKVLYPWKSIDLMRILAFDKLGISLKQTAINLKWYKIQDIPIDPEASVKREELMDVLSYNLNDVLITEQLYYALTPLRQLRKDLSKLYNVDLSSASDSRIANLILENIYANELKMDMRSVKSLRTPREKVVLGTCMAKFIRFQSPELKNLYKEIASKVVYSYSNFQYNASVYYANCYFSVGIGGLHTEDAPGIFESDDEYLIQDMDVASYYPNLIINNNFYPQHLGPQFIDVLKKITAERLAAKKSGDKVKADGLKITINSIFGKTGSEHFWLYDPKQFLSTTISGQMGLLMLVEGMYMNGIEVISCNTDGVVCKIRRNMLDKYYEVAHAWEKATSLELEFTPYKKYVRRDVNSYITIKEDGTTKEKGAFLKEVDLKKSYHMPIVAKALYAYYVYGTPVRKTLEDCKDIMEFCISQKSGPNFGIELHVGNKIEKQQKTNRFYISTKGGALLKRHKISNQLTGLYVGRLVQILNNFYDKIPFEAYNVDLSFYEKEVMKIVDEIEPKQMTLFNLDFKESGKKVAMESSQPKITEEEKNDVTSLNRLGKNQLMKRIETIAMTNKTIDGIGPRYMFIKDLDIKNMFIKVYCLSKGIEQTLKLDRSAYKKTKIEAGDMIYGDRFEKVKGEYMIMEYHIKNSLEEKKEKLI